MRKYVVTGILALVSSGMGNMTRNWDMCLPGTSIFWARRNLPKA